MVGLYFRVSAQVTQVFGEPISGSTQETASEINRLIELLSGDLNKEANPGSGKQIYQKKCATCHKLFGEGENVGPPLDAYDRANLKFWLPAIVAPSLEIREGFQSYAVVTTNGQVITGTISAQNRNTVTIRTADHQTVVVDRAEIDTLQAIKTSLMPADLLKDLNAQQIRDLFAYLSLRT